MKPTDQTKFGWDGNCLAACVASLLEFDLKDLPDTGGTGGLQRLCEWLAPRGLLYLEVWRGHLSRSKNDEEGTLPMVLGWQPLIYAPLAHPRCVLCGPSPRGFGLQHCVVGRSNGLKWTIEHDPHPSRAGILSLTHLGFLIEVEGV